MTELLESAHIIPVELDGSDSSLNGLPLCPTHNTACDSFLFTIDPSNHNIILRKGLIKEDIAIKQ